MFGKVFTQMFDGTLATKGPWQAIVTFQQLICLADKDGSVDMTPEAISRRTTIPLDIIKVGITALEQPDPESRTPDEGGRRIVRLNEHRDWGWKLVNYEKYAGIRNNEGRREYMKQYQRARRSVDPVKARAHFLVGEAVKSGRLIPSPCAVCGDGNKPHAHHEDYSKPYEITWLCPMCHAARHKELRNVGNSYVNEVSHGDGDGDGDGIDPVDGFVDFWEAYPSKSGRRVNRPACEKKWKSKRLAWEFVRVMDGLAVWKKSAQWLKDGGAFIPLMATFLTQDKWANPPAAASMASQFSGAL